MSRPLALFLVLLFALVGLAAPNGPVLVCHRTGRVTPLALTVAPSPAPKLDDCCAEDDPTGAAMLLQAHCCDLRPALSRAAATLPSVQIPPCIALWQPVALVSAAVRRVLLLPAYLLGASAAPRAPPEVAALAPRAPPVFR